MTDTLKILYPGSLPLLAFLAVAPLSSVVSAQNNTHFALEEVIVTSERRSASLQDIPIAISAFTESELEARQIGEPLDLIDFVPNLFGSNNTALATANVYYLRGLGNTESIATFDPPVGTYVDEVYIARQNGNNVAFFDVERVEVLRGPQGTLFGRNTTGGAISVHMKKPSEELGGFIEAGYGDFDRWQVRGTMDVPVSDNVLTKLTAFEIDGKGYVENITTGDDLNGEKSKGIRGDLRLKSGALLWDLGLEYAEDQSLNLVSAFRGQTIRDPGPSNNSDSRFAQTGIRSTESEGSAEQLSRGEGLGAKVESWGVTSRLNWSNDYGSLDWISSYRELSQDFIVDLFDGPGPVGAFVIANQGQHDQLSQELKYSSDSITNLSWVAGLYYFTEENTADITDVFSGFVLGDRLITNDLETFAAYAQGDYSITDKFTVTLGARWTREEKDITFTDTKNALLAANLPNLSGVPTTPATELSTANLIAEGIPDTLTKTKVTPRLAVQYQARDDLMLFASATQGFKSGGWNARGNTNAENMAFDPEIVWSYEAGLRSEWLDNRLRVNLTAFYMDVEDFQVPSSFPRENGSIAFITRNFADFENKGIELDVTATPVEGLTIYSSLGFQDAEQKPGAEVRALIAACLADGTGAATGIVDPDCNVAEPTRTPDLTFNIGANYQFAIADGILVQPSLNYRYVDEQYVGTSGTDASQADGYSNINAALKFSFMEQRLSLTAECSNCTNEIVLASIIANTLYYNEPRRYNLRLRYDF